MCETIRQERTPWPRIVAFLATGLLVLCSGFGAEPKGVPVTNCIRQVDHIVVASSEAKRLFSLLAETFELPVAWPMAQFGTFASGGVSLGNANLEVIQSANGSSAKPRTHFTGLALEPEPLESVLPMLERRSIAHGKAMPFRTWEGLFPKKLWTTVSLPSVSNDALSVFLCEYELDAAARRKKLNEELRARNGGPLTILSVREVVVGTADMPQAESEWEELLLPVKRASSDTWKLWKLKGGPAIRLDRNENAGIRGLVIEIDSLEKARAFLKERGLDASEEGGVLLLTAPLLNDLKISLVPVRK